MVAIYARQSIYKPDSLSIEGQIEQCKKMLADNEAYSVYQDSGYSGKNTDRPDYSRMEKDIEKGLIDKIIVYKLDRITRSISDFGTILDMIKRNKISFVSVSENFDTKSPIGEAMLAIIAVFANMERNNLIQRVTDNYSQRAKQGFYTSGPAPYGFKLVKTEHLGKKTSMLAPVEDEVNVIVELYKRYAYDETSSLNQLSLWLNDNGILTKQGNPWVSSTIANILMNPIYVKADADIYTYLHDVKGATMNNNVKEYLGVNACYVYKPASSNGKRTRLLHMTNACVSLAPHEGIIDSHTWLKCQQRLSKNKSIKRSGKGSYSWLSGLMECGYCHYAVMAVHNKNGKTYINCGGQKRHKCNPGRQRTVQICEIENIVAPLLLDRIREIKEVDIPETKQDSRKVNELKIKMAEVNEVIANLVDNLTLISGAAVDVVNKRINKECAKRDELAEQLKQAYEEERQQDYSRIDFDEIIKGWDGFDIEKKKGIAKIFIEKVIVTDKEITPVFK